MNLHLDASLVLGLVSAGFGVFALIDWGKTGGPPSPRQRTWLMVCAIFGGLSLYLRFA